MFLEFINDGIWGGIKDTNLNSYLTNAPLTTCLGIQLRFFSEVSERYRLGLIRCDFIKVIFRPVGIEPTLLV